MKTSIQDVRSAAAQYSAIGARSVNLDVIAREFSDPRDVAAVHMAIVTANMHLEWNDPHVGRKVRIVAVTGAPLFLASLAIIWWSWKIRFLVDWIWRKVGK